jgi:hypothetical protein
MIHSGLINWTGILPWLGVQLLGAITTAMQTVPLRGTADAGR